MNQCTLCGQSLVSCDGKRLIHKCCPLLSPEEIELITFALQNWDGYIKPQDGRPRRNLDFVEDKVYFSLRQRFGLTKL